MNWPISELARMQQIYTKYNTISRACLQNNDSLRFSTSAAVELAKYSLSRIPFYRELYKDCKIDILNEATFKELPFIGKNDLLFSNIYMRDPTVDSVFLSYTNGTSGGRAPIGYDLNAANWSSANTLYCRSKTGYQWLGKKVQITSQHQPTSLSNKYLKNVLFRNKELDMFELTEESIQQLCVNIKQSGATFAAGLPSHFMLMAPYFRDVKGDASLIIETTGEELTSPMRRVISDSFNAAVFDRYGMAEVGIVAYQHESSSEWLRVVHPFVHVEIGGNNEIIITSLKNYAMPLVRYKTGDFCTDWKVIDGSLYLKGIKGRSTHLLHILDGFTVSSIALENILFACPNIVEVQFFIDKNDHLDKLSIYTSNASSIDPFSLLKSSSLLPKAIVQRLIQIINVAKLTEIPRTGTQQKIVRVVQC